MPTLTYENNYIKDSETVDTTTLKINALDSFGQELEAQIVLKNGTFAGGNIVNYIITATDAAGNTNELNDVAVKVYSKEDIKFSYKDSMSYSIKISSHGEEFITSVTDSFGESCTTQLELAEGYSLKGGRKVSLYVVATDSAGNIQKSNLFTNVKVFDIPTLSIADDTKGLTITDIEDLETLFVVQDSFGENLIYTVETMDTIVAGQYIDVSISARDEANNDFLATHRVAVIEDNKTCVVSLFFGDKFLDTIIVNDANNYTLPIPAEYTSPKGWYDATGTAYTDSQGKGYLTLSTTTINCLYLHTNSTIYSVNDLKRMSLSGNYTLMSDLNLQGAEWTPIGTKNSPFKGTFNGNGHVIANYKITSQTQYAGLFGYISNSTIQNLRVVDFVINISYADKYTGWVIANFAGGISGFNNLGNIKNCYASGSITTISNEVSYRYHAHTYTGGLVGYNSGTIANCHTAGSIMATAHDESYAGGLIGYNIGSIKNCYASSTVTATAQDNGQIYTGHYPNPNVFAGGLVGWNGVENIDDKIKAIIINSYASGNVTATAYSSYSYDPYEHSSSYASASATAYAGGLVGCNNGELSTIKTSYATGDVSARAQAYAYSSTGSTYQAPKAYVGGLVGGDHFNLGKGTIVNCLRSNEQAIMWNVSSSSISSIGGRNYLGTSVSRSELQSESFLIDTLKWDSDNWIFNIDAYPTLRFE